jgi:hypothetical protein
MVLDETVCVLGNGMDIKVDENPQRWMYEFQGRRPVGPYVMDADPNDLWPFLPIRIVAKDRRHAYSIFSIKGPKHAVVDKFTLLGYTDEHYGMVDDPFPNGAPCPCGEISLDGSSLDDL